MNSIGKDHAEQPRTPPSPTSTTTMPATKKRPSSKNSSSTPAGGKKLKREEASFLSPAAAAVATTGIEPPAPAKKKPRVPPKDLKRPRSAYMIWKAKPENKDKAAGVLKIQWKEYSFRTQREAAEEEAKEEARAMASRLMEWFVDSIAACEREAAALEPGSSSREQAAASVSCIQEWCEQMRSTRGRCFTFDLLYKLETPEYPQYPALYNRFNSLEERSKHALEKARASLKSLEADSAGRAAAGLEARLLRVVETARSCSADPLSLNTAGFRQTQEELTAALAAAAAWRAEFPKPIDHAGLNTAVGEARAERSRLESLVAADEAMHKARSDDFALVKQLQGAGAEELQAFATAHRERQESIVLLEDANKSLRQRVALLEQEGARSAVRNGHAATILLGSIASALESQLVYTGPRLKKHAVPVGYSCSGVSPAIFAQAFGLPPGSSCSNTTISALKLGIQNKGLRYGSVLALSGPVALSLKGDRLTASGAYKLF